MNKKLCNSDHLYASHTNFLGTDTWTLWRYLKPNEVKKTNCCNETVFSCVSKPEFNLRLVVMGLKLGKCYNKNSLFRRSEFTIMKLNCDMANKESK